MPKPPKDSRIGVYKCTIVNGFVSKGDYIRGDYIGVFTWDDLVYRIIPDLRQYRLRGSEYPVLITSWRLREGDPPKPIPIPAPHQKLNVKSVGVRDLKRMFGLPVRRKKDPRSETWEAVVYATGRAVKVVGQKLVD
jgi:hypothetical protein